MSDDEEFNIEKIMNDAAAFEGRPSQDFLSFTKYVEDLFPNKTMSSKRFMAFIIDVVLRKRKSMSSISEMDSSVSEAINWFERDYIKVDRDEKFPDELFESCISDNEISDELLNIFKSGGLDALGRELVSLKKSKEEAKLVA